LIDLYPIWLNIKDGDYESFEQLFKILSRPLFRYALAIVKDDQLAEEIVHDVFINLWNNRNKIIISGSVRSYLYRVVHNMAVNHIIRQKRKKNQIEIKITDETWKIIKETCSYDSFLTEAIEAEETQKIISEAINELPEQCRQIFIMSRYDGKQNDEISSALDISINTVRTQLFRAIKKIRERLSEKFPDLL